MIKTILFDMGGTLEDIWYNDQTIRTVTGELRTFLDEHDLGTGCNDITFWNKLNSGIRTYKQWSESNELEKKPEEIWPEYYMADFNLNRERLQEVAERLAGMWEVTYYHSELRPKVKETLEELKKRGAKNVLVSMAGDGALLYTETGEVYFAPAAKGTLINSTGAGDSMVGGFLAEFTRSGDFAKALAMGTAAGGATAFSVGIAGFQKIMAVHESVKAGVQRVR